MSDFKVGDWVYGGDWCYGQIIGFEDGEDYIAIVEYEASRGGGTFGFYISELTAAEPPKEYPDIKRLCNWSFGGNDITGEFSLTLYNLDENGDEIDSVFIDMNKGERDKFYKMLKRFIGAKE